MGDENDSGNGTASSDLVDQLISNKKYENWLSTLMNNAMKPEFQELKKTVTELREETHGLKKENEELHEEINVLKVDRDESKSEIQRLKWEKENNTHAIEETDRHLEQLRTTVSLQGERVEELQQYTRRNCLLVTGIPESTGENTDELIQELARDKMNFELKEYDIDRTHRTGQSYNGKPRAIAVKFTRYTTRNNFIKNRKQLRGTKIGVQEMLTPYTRGLLKRAQDLVEQAHWVKGAWTWDGRVNILVQPLGCEKPKRETVKNQADLYSIFNRFAKQHMDLRSQLGSEQNPEN